MGIAAQLHISVVKERDMGDREACDECKQKCLLIHGKKTDPSPRVTTFRKVLRGAYYFSKDLILPQKISQVIPVLAAGENYILQDTNGLRWEVKLDTKDGRLAFREGWNKFYKDHGLRGGYVLIFHYIMNSHFIVEIFDETGFEKLMFPIANERKRKISEIDGNCNAVGECQNLSNHSTKKQGTAFTGTSDSGARTNGQPMSKDKPSSLEIENGKYQHVAPASCGTEQFYMINRDDGYNYEKDKSPLLNLSNSKMRFLVDPDGSSDRRTRLFNTLAESDAVAGNLNENPVSAKVVSGKLPAEVAAASTLSNNITSKRAKVTEVDNDHQGDHPCFPPIENPDQVHSEYRNKSLTAPSKRVIEEAAGSKNHSSEIVPITELMDWGISPSYDFKSSNVLVKVRRVGKTQPVVDSFNDDRRNASAVLFKATVRSREILELPKSVTLWACDEKKLVNLRGPDKMLWPVLYQNRFGIKALTSGWENFFMSCGLHIGDKCAFILEDEANAICRIVVGVKRKWDELPVKLRSISYLA